MAARDTSGRVSENCLREGSGVVEKKRMAWGGPKRDWIVEQEKETFS